MHVGEHELQRDMEGLNRDEKEDKMMAKTIGRAAICIDKGCGKTYMTLEYKDDAYIIIL